MIRSFKTIYAAPRDPDLDRIRCDDLDLSNRSANALRNWDAFATLGLLDVMTVKELLRIPGIGHVSIQELRTIINDFKRQRQVEQDRVLAFKVTQADAEVLIRVLLDAIDAETKRLELPGATIHTTNMAQDIIGLYKRLSIALGKAG